MLKTYSLLFFSLFYAPILRGQNNGCQVPSTFFYNSGNYIPTREILLGQGRLYPVWGETVDAYIPENRKTWAIALVHAAQLVKNVAQTDKISPNFYFATAIKESFCGCDAAIQPAPSGTPFPFKYNAITLQKGCFQIDPPTAYLELTALMPQRFPYGQHPQIAGNEHFEMAALTRAYYDIFSLKLMEYSRKWTPRDFFNSAADPNATVKIMATAYYRGLWYSPLANVLVTDRTRAQGLNNISNYFSAEAETMDYENSLSNYTAILDNNRVWNLSPDLFKINPQTGRQYNQFDGYYNKLIAWSDVSTYLDLIMPMYPNIDKSTLKNSVKAVFDGVNNGNPISFRYKFGLVLDKIMQSLPSDDPTAQIANLYGCNGENTANGFITRRHEPTLMGDKFKVYPNPTSDIVQISIENPPKTPIEWTITNTHGQVLYYEKQGVTLDSYEKTIDITKLPSGVFNLQIRTLGQPVNKKIVKL